MSLCMWVIDNPMQADKRRKSRDLSPVRRRWWWWGGGGGGFCSSWCSPRVHLAPAGGDLKLRKELNLHSLITTLNLPPILCVFFNSRHFYAPYLVFHSSFFISGTKCDIGKKKKSLVKNKNTQKKTFKIFPSLLNHTVIVCLFVYLFAGLFKCIM